MNSRIMGWTIFYNDIVIGCVTYSDHIPKLSVTSHMFIDPNYHTKWWDEKLPQEWFNYAFNTLKCRRVNAIPIRNITSKAKKETSPKDCASFSPSLPSR